MSARAGKLPLWIDIGVIPILNVLIAFGAAALVVLAIGASPLDAVKFMLTGALGDSEAVGYTLYYTTNFIFTGLAVAVAFHAGLFNIGGEGQATLGGLGAGLAALAMDHAVPPLVAISLGIAAAAGFGALWAAIPGYLQAYRGSHIVITTIMFNFIAAALMNYLMVNVLIAPGSMSPESRSFTTARLPVLSDILNHFGFAVATSPLNLSTLLAVVCCFAVWILIWHTPFGYETRATGFNSSAAIYAGVSPRRMTVVVMCISGALAGCVGVNEILGVHHRLLLDFAGGYGFGGIAVALMGRNHPLGIVLASLLFGILQQGGTELSFDIPTITRDMVVAIQGLVILFSGALAALPRPLLEAPFLWLAQRHARAGEEA